MSSQSNCSITPTGHQYCIVNEVVWALDKLEIDTKEWVDTTATNTFGFSRFAPRTGVGGYCIPVVSRCLILNTGESGVENRSLKKSETKRREARIRRQKPIGVFNVERILPKISLGPRIGMSFKTNISDNQYYPYNALKEDLERFGVSNELNDIYLPKAATINSLDIKADTVVVMTNHDEFQDLSFEELSNRGISVVIDGQYFNNQEKVISSCLRHTGPDRWFV